MAGLSVQLWQLGGGGSAAPVHGRSAGGGRADGAGPAGLLPPAGSGIGGAGDAAIGAVVGSGRLGWACLGDACPGGASWWGGRGAVPGPPSKSRGPLGAGWVRPPMA